MVVVLVDALFLQYPLVKTSQVSFTAYLIDLFLLLNFCVKYERFFLQLKTERSRFRSSFDLTVIRSKSGVGPCPCSERTATTCAPCLQDTPGCQCEPTADHPRIPCQHLPERCSPPSETACANRVGCELSVQHCGGSCGEVCPSGTLGCWRGAQQSADASPYATRAPTTFVHRPPG